MMNSPGGTSFSKILACLVIAKSGGLELVLSAGAAVTSGIYRCGTHTAALRLDVRRPILPRSREAGWNSPPNEAAIAITAAGTQQVRGIHVKLPTHLTIPR